MVGAAGGQQPGADGVEAVDGPVHDRGSAARVAFAVCLVEAERDASDGQPGVHGLAVNVEVDLAAEHAGPPTGGFLRVTRHMRPARGLVRHGMVVAGLADWLTGHLGFDPLTGVTTFDWLATPTQTLAEVTGGAVFHDGLRQLHQARQALAWYPDDVWRYVLACQWRRISQEEAFVGRCGEAGDDLGSAIVTARLTRDLVRLCLLMNRVYPPYGKWLGSAFARLPCAGVLTPVLTAALAATGWHDRERHLTRAYGTIADLHNELGLTDWVEPTARPFHDRPFQVLDADRFTTALTDTITGPKLHARPLTGALDQSIDNTDALGDRARGPALANALDVADLPDAPGPESGRA
ncbi:DUF4037 domain-containing protein [Pseudofrankia sp. BMG5.36]|uniref:DUF4037 domain-containing protein n=1 Tax=Pseudofrankia sp. BMG5.36 TaxID=1834512 RepID=UPI0009F3F708|nr:DUF4037 domain-containing protein [Pseudofrankia sp. BMG5.36]